MGARDISSLAEIAKSQPHAAYIALTKVYKSKFTYFMQTIEAFEEYVDPVHETLNEVLLPQFFGKEEPLADELCELVNSANPDDFQGTWERKEERVLDVEMGSFTQLVFGTDGGIGSECQKFLKQLAQKLAKKDNERDGVVIAWLRTRISFEILR